MSYLVRRLIATAALTVPCAAQAFNWRFVDRVTPPTSEYALICHFWNTTVYAPGEKGSCNVGTIYAANLTTGEIGYAAAGYQGMPSSRSERELNRDTLIHALKGDALAKLDALHDKLKSERAAAAAAAAAEREKLNAERTHAEYLQAFQDAKTLQRVQDFETRYRDNDPDGLIAKLAPAKAAFEHQAYRDAYAGAATSAQLKAFVDAYGVRDPDHLVPDARKRLATVKKQEQLAAQAVEKKVREDAAKEAAAARQLALKKDADRLQYIRSLQARFGDRITAESAEGYSIVSRYRIDCRAGDGRVLPLLNALYASIVSLENSGVQMRFHIQNRGQRVRITSEVTKNGKPMGPRELYYEINEWGDLSVIAIRNEAVLNACYGFQGSIWLMPGEPGYQS